MAARPADASCPPQEPAGDRPHVDASEEPLLPPALQIPPPRLAVAYPDQRGPGNGIPESVVQPNRLPHRRISTDWKKALMGSLRVRDESNMGAVTTCSSAASQSRRGMGVIEFSSSHHKCKSSIKI